MRPEPLKQWPYKPANGTSKLPAHLYQPVCGGCGKTTGLAYYYLGDRYCQTCWRDVLADLSELHQIGPLDRTAQVKRVCGWLGGGLLLLAALWLVAVVVMSL